LSCGGIENVPVVHRSISDKTQAGVAEEFPEYNILVHCRGFQLGFGRKVKYLQRPLLRLERDDLFAEVHDGTISLDGTSCDIVVVLEVNDDDF
jgi:hypothetical protein